MNWDWNDILKLPQSALAGDRRIPKTVLSKQGNLTAKEQKVLNKVRSLQHFAAVQKSNTRIPARIDDKYDVQSIVYLKCELKPASEAYAEIASLLHKSFPNPTVVLFGGGERACISAAMTRKSHSEHGALVVEKIESTQAFDSCDDAYEGFLASMAFESLPQKDLYAFQSAVMWNVRLARMIPMLGFYPLCESYQREEVSRLIDQVDELDQKIDAAQDARRDKETGLNESARTRIKMEDNKEERAAVLEEIKELCRA